MNKLEAQFNYPRFKKQHFVRNKDGSVYCVYMFYIIEEYVKRNVNKFAGDSEKALEWTITKYITSPQDIVAVGPMLYKEERESFLKQATLLVKAYDDPNRIFNEQNDHEFKMEFTNPTAESDEVSTGSLTIKADRFEVALALWENTTGSHYLLDRVTELELDKIVNVWEAPDTSTFERDDLILIFSA
ncbi:hypothetical protein ACK2M2_13590 [Acinetobacter sp. TY1]|uniref:hypothetical protein n=1 Tax=Acinetobacter sp. TY1 TaxID=3387626 RepID=UPI003AF892AD